MAYGGPQAKGRIWATAAILHHSHSNVRSELCQQCRIRAYTAAHGSDGSLTHWVRPGIKPASSWILVRFVSAEPWWELQASVLLMSGLVLLWSVLCRWHIYFSLKILRALSLFFWFQNCTSDYLEKGFFSCIIWHLEDVSIWRFMSFNSRKLSWIDSWIFYHLLFSMPFHYKCYQSNQYWWLFIQ